MHSEKEIIVCNNKKKFNAKEKEQSINSNKNKQKLNVFGALRKSNFSGEYQIQTPETQTVNCSLSIFLLDRQIDKFI